MSTFLIFGIFFFVIVISIARPLWGLLLAVFITPFHFFISSFWQLGSYGIGAMIVDLAFLGVILGLLFRIVILKIPFKPYLSPIYLVIFLLYNLLAVIGSPDKFYAFGEFKWLALYPLLVYLVSNVINTREQLSKFLRGLLVLTILLATFGIFDSLLHDKFTQIFRYDVWSVGQGYYGGFVRAAGGQDNAVVFGGIMSMMALLSIGITSMRSAGWTKLGFASLLFSLFAMVLSFSGSALLALAVGVVCILWLRRDWKSAFFFSIAGITFISVDRFLMQGIYFLRLNPFDVDSVGMISLMGRLSAFRIGFSLWAQNPIWGYGLGSLLNQTFNPGIYDSFYLHLLVSSGLIGLVAHLILFLFLILKGIHLWHKVKDRALKNIIAALVTLVISTAVLNVFSSDFTAKTYTILFWVMMGLLVAIERMVLNAQISRGQVYDQRAGKN